MIGNVARRWLSLGILLWLAGCGLEPANAPQGDYRPGAQSEVDALEAELTTPVAVVVPAAQDTTVRLTAQNKNFGAANELDINRTLVQFDTAAIAAAVGPQDVLVSAKFELTLTNNALRRTTAKRTVDAFRLTKAWTEKGATWNCAIDSNTSNSLPNCTSAATAWSMGVLPPNPWAAPATATITIAATQTGVASFDVTADVKKFLSNQATNHGWMLRGSTPGEFAEFASRETATPPRLILSVRRCGAALCDDGNACTADSCDATASCVHAPLCTLYGVGSISGDTVGGLDLSPEILEGGFQNDQVSAFGSAIAYTGVDDLYIATPDRGPADGKTSFADRYYLIDLSLDAGSVTPTLVGAATLNQSPGVTFLGKNTEFDATNSPASRRFDPEGVRVSPQGTFYVSDEYGPFLYEFAANGDRLRVLDVPDRYLIANPALEAAELPPANSAGRQANRGMEGLAISPDGQKLYGMMQNALIQDGALDATNKRVGLNTRILEIDTDTGATREFLYKLADKAYGVSEIIAVNAHQFLVLERDSLIGNAAVFKRLFLIDIDGATDISAIDALPVSDTPAGVTAVGKVAFLDLLAPEFGLAGASFPEKIEGLAFGPDLADGRHVLVVTNDNDGNTVQANNFYVFAIDGAALPGYAEQDATFSNACGAAACDAQDACHKDGICNPGTGACSAPRQPVGTSCGGSNVCDADGDCAQCVSADSCPGTDGVCGARTCTDGECGFAFDPAGTECGTDQACDGAGTCVTNAHVVINEVESNTSPATPDWVELYNAGANEADISGWEFIDGDDTHTPYTFPANTKIPAGGYLVIEENATFNFGLGTSDTPRLYNAQGVLVDSRTWSAHAVTTYGLCPNGGASFTTMTSITKGAVNDCSLGVKINEVESNLAPQTVPVTLDWVELYNAGPLAVDLSGYIVKDNDDLRIKAIPAGTTLAPGAYYVIETEAAPNGYGLGGADSARLFDPTGTILIDGFAWTAHATVTWERCPNGTGAFGQSVAPTRGSANGCGTVPPPPPPPPPVLPVWPGSNTVTTVGPANVFGADMSGVFYEPATASAPAVLWAVRNGTGTLFRLVWNGSIWTMDTDNGWTDGKLLKYAGSVGRPDSEGVTRGEYDEPFIYVATERNNDANTIPRRSVLRFDISGTSTAPLVATHEWDLTSDLPALVPASGGANLGLEGIAYYPDDLLVAKGFRDENMNAPYVPSSYPDHGEGLFLVGLEQTGIIYAYALDHVTGVFSRVASFSGGNPQVMDVTLDREVGYLWATGDDTLQGVMTVLDVDTAPVSSTFGRFIVKRQLARASTMPNINNEGFAIATESECASGQKPVFFVDDGQTGGHALRRDSIPCGAFLSAP